MNREFLIEQTANRAQAPVVRRAQAHFLAQMRAVLVIFPKCARRKALSRRARRRIVVSSHRVVMERIARIVALIIGGIRPARIVRVILNLVDAPVEVGSCVNELELVYTAVNRQCRVLELVLVVGWVI